MGALTLKTFSDESREWEFTEREAFDPTDSFGTSLRLSIKENQIFLAEPNDPKMPWLTDKGRLFFDSTFEISFTKSTNWKKTFNNVLELIYFVDHLNLHKRNVFLFVFVFENLSLEILNILYLLKQNCSFIEMRKANGYKDLNDFESHYQLGPSVEKPKLHMSTLGILVNTNPRYEGYLLNINLRQRFLKGDFKLLNFGTILDLTFPTYNLGSSFNILNSLIEGNHISCQDIKNAEFPVILTNTELFKRTDAKIVTKVLNIAFNLNVLNHNICSVGTQALNRFLSLSVEDFSNFFFLYYINVSLSSTANMKKLVEFHMLQAFNSSKILADRVFVDQNINSLNKSVYIKLKNKLFNYYFYLPNNLFLEDNETYINTQGLIKRTTKLLHLKKNVKTNWQIIRKFYANTKSVVFFNNHKDNISINFNSINSFNFKNYTNFQFYAVQTLTSLSLYLTKNNLSLTKLPIFSIKSYKIKVLNTKTKCWLDDFFNTNGKDFFSYNSSVLANCSKITRSSATNFF